MFNIRDYCKYVPGYRVPEAVRAAKVSFPNGDMTETTDHCTYMAAL